MTYRYVNNWERGIALAEGAETSSVDLPDGRYRLVLRDDDRTRFEIVDAVVESGTATLERGLEGTAQQEWPDGSFVYCALTAEQIQRLAQAGLTGEGPPQGVVVAPLGTTYIDDLDSGVWTCVWSDGVDADWVQLAPLDIASLVSGVLGLSIPLDGEWLLAPGASVEFLFEDAIYSSVPLTGTPRRYQPSSLTHVRTKRILEGGIALIATPLTQF